MAEEFEFMFDDSCDLEEGELRDVEVLQILKGDLDPIHTYSEELAYKNLDFKMPDNPNVGKMIKL